MSETTKTETDTITLEDAVHRWGHGREDFARGVREGATAMQLQYMAVYKFPSRRESGDVDPWGDGPFAWIDILRTEGWTDERIKELLLGVLAYEDPNTDFPEALRPLIGPHGGPAWKLLETDEFVRLIEHHVKRLAYEIVQHNRMIAYAIGVTRKAMPKLREGLSLQERAAETAAAYIAAGEADALLLARRAAHSIGFIGDEESLATVRKLPAATQVEIAFRYEANCAPSQPLNNRIMAGFFLTLILENSVPSEQRDRLMYMLVDALHPRPATKQDNDMERPVRAYRWFLKFMREAPLPKREAWMDDRLTPESCRARHIRELDTQFRAALEKSGWRFLRVERRQNPRNGREDLVAPLQKGSFTNLYIHDVRGNRNERIEDAMEVMVPSHMTGQPLFRAGPTLGWRYELHPVAPPTHEMVKNLGHHNGF